MMNEPHPGYIGLPSLNAFDYNTDLHLSHVRESITSVLRIVTNCQWVFLTYSICFPVIPIGNWTSDIGVNMDSFLPYAN